MLRAITMHSNCIDLLRMQLYFDFTGYICRDLTFDRLAQRFPKYGSRPKQASRRVNKRVTPRRPKAKFQLHQSHWNTMFVIQYIVS